MAYLYIVDLSNGESYNVTTDKHHDHHTREAFIQVLRDIIVRTGTMVASTAITRFVFKGTK